jgi:curli biogenesis system outer membrane secretion channel CsgG
MKKYAILFLLFSGCATIGTVSEVNLNKDFPHHEIQKIAVLILETSWQDQDKEKTSFGLSNIVSPDAGTILADIIARELAKWGRYVVLDRRALKEELELINLNEKNILHSKDYLNLGKSLGVDAVVIGKVEKFGISYRSIPPRFAISLTTKVSFLARCIDVTTNEVVWSIKIDGTSKKDNEKSLASKLVAKTVKLLEAEMK